MSKFRYTLKIFAKIDNADDCVNRQYNLDLVSDWCTKLKLSVNTQKCNVMPFTLKLFPILHDYSINNIIIRRPYTFCDLGIILDKTLSFNTHVDIIISKAT